VSHSKPEPDDVTNGTPTQPTHAYDSTGTNEHWLRSVVQNTTDIVVVVGPEGTLRYASPAWERVLGHDAEATVGNVNVLDYVHPDDLPHVLQRTEEALSKGGTTSNTAEYRFRHADGSWRWVESVGTYLLDDPAVGGVVVTTRDITDRKEAEERLREAEERYRTLVETIPALTYIQEIKDGTSATIYVSPQVEDIVGYTPEECTATPDLWKKVLHPEDRDRVLAEDWRSNETGDPFAMEYRQFARDGSVVWVRDEATLVRDGEGEPLYWLGVQVDITERKRAEEALKEAEDRYHTLVEQIPAVTYIDKATDGPDEPIYTSPQIETLLGYTPEEWLEGRLWPERLHPEDKERILAADERFEVGGGEPFSEEYRLIARDGSVVWVREDAVLLRNEEGKPLCFQGVILDITIQKMAEEALKGSEERLRALANAAFEGILINDQGLILEANRALTDMFGYEVSEVIGRSTVEFVVPEDRDLVEQKIASGAEEPYEVTGVRQDGTLLNLEVRGRPYSYRGRSVRVTAIRDITERKEAEKRLEYLAFHDALTNLPNRQLLLDRLGQALRRTRRQPDRRVAVLLMDLDNFKGVNDSLGHGTGDLLLVLLAERLKGCLRPEDTLTRIGGDEFVVLLEDVEGPEEAVGVAERIVDEVNRPFVLEGQELYVSASIGIALGEDHPTTPEDLLRDADTAMYWTKERGLDYAEFDPTMDNRALRRLEAAIHLRRAIEQDEFVVHYQPIVSLQTGAVLALEALVRWEHPERGPLDPVEFVASAEQSGLVVPMGERVLREACLRAKRWQERHPRTPPLVISANLSAKQLSRPDLAETVESILKETELEGRHLTLDITETVYVEALAGNTAVLDHLRGLGVKIALDDFGTGFSSLSYLKRLPADAIKIDGSFVKGLGEDVEDTAIVRMIVELAHTLGIEVVAEGVESEVQARQLREIGCDMAQGFHFAEPLPPEEAWKYLNAAYRSDVQSNETNSLSDSL
jgi:diguanylate cyclase (GGDEF)-like protein/PAS domain S-box-containing protein